MVARRVIPLHDDRPEPGIEVVLHQSGRISLLVDQCDGRPYSQKALIRFVSQAKIRSVYFRRHQRTNQLHISTANQLTEAFTTQSCKFDHPSRINASDAVQCVGRGFDANRKSKSSDEMQQRPVTTLNYLGALVLFDRGISQVQVEKCEESQTPGR